MKKFRNFGAVLLCAMVCVFFVGCGTSGSNDTQTTIIRTDLTSAIESNYTNTISITAMFPDGSGARGTGVLVYKGGYIATNAHVISKSVNDLGTITHEIAEEIKIEFWTEDDYKGMWVYQKTAAEEAAYTRTMTDISYNQNNPYDSNNKGVLYWNIEEDLAILKCPNMPIEYVNKAAVLRNAISEPLKIGEPVAALGWSLGYFYRSSVGTISSYMDRFIALDGDTGVTKDFDFAILHDAVIINGNSGGPLLDSEGRLLGLNTLILYLDAYADTDVSGGGGHISVLVDVYTPGLGFSVAMSSMTIRSKLRALNIMSAEDMI